MVHAARWECFRVIYGRYSKAEGKAKRGMLDEFCLNTGYHRKYAIGLLNGPPPGLPPPLFSAFFAPFKGTPPFAELCAYSTCLSFGVHSTRVIFGVSFFLCQIAYARVNLFPYIQKT